MTMQSELGGRFHVGSKTATAATAFAQLVPPARGGASPFIYKLESSQPNWYGGAYTHISALVYSAGTTAHDVVVMRPFNWTTVAAAVLHNATAVTLDWDPGLYSTKYKYPTPGNTTVAGVSNNAIAAGDYLAVQLRDGTWFVDTVASGSGTSIVLTGGTPNVSGGGIAAGQVIFFFGVAADSDPATAKAHLPITSTASTRVNLCMDGASTIPSLHPGDPLIVYSANGTAAGVLNSVGGYYSNHP